VFEANQIIPGGIKFQEKCVCIYCNVEYCRAVFMAIKVANGLCDAYTRDRRCAHNG